MAFTKFLLLSLFLTSALCAETYDLLKYSQVHVSYMPAPGKTLVWGAGQDSVLFSTVDNNSSKVTSAAQIGNGLTSWNHTVAFKPSGGFYVILQDFDSSMYYLLDLDSQFQIKTTFELGDSVFCSLLDLTGSTLTCFDALAIHQFDVQDESVTYLRTVNIHASWNTEGTIDWIKTSDGEYIGYGSQNPGLGVIVLEASLSVKQMWTFAVWPSYNGNNSSWRIRELPTAPGVFALLGLGQQSFVGFVDLNSATPFKLDQFFNLPFQFLELEFIGRGVNSETVVYSLNNMMSFNYDHSTGSATLSWSAYLYSDDGNYKIGGIAPGVGDNLLVFGHTEQETNDLSALNIQVMDGTNGVLLDVKDIHSNPGGQTTSNLQSWTNLPKKTSVAVSSAVSNPWSISKVDALPTKVLIENGTSSNVDQGSSFLAQ